MCLPSFTAPRFNFSITFVKSIEFHTGGLNSPQTMQILEISYCFLQRMAEKVIRFKTHALS